MDDTEDEETFPKKSGPQAVSVYQISDWTLDKLIENLIFGEQETIAELRDELADALRELKWWRSVSSGD